MTDAIQFHVGDGDSLPFILSRLMGCTITVNLKNGRYAEGDIVDPYYNGGSHLRITKGSRSPGHLEFEYDRIESIEYA